MFIVDLKYITELSRVDEHLIEHRDWLQLQYDKGLLLCSGSKNPRDGGVIIALGDDREKVEEMMRHDPFTLNNISIYTITEFNPVKHHKDLQLF